jgi:hypothetical protein
LLETGHANLMWHGIATLWASAISAWAQATATHSSSTLTTASYSLTLSSTTAHSTHLIVSTSRRDSHNMARGMLKELLVRTCQSTTLWEAMGSSGRMDRDFPCPFRVLTQTKILFQIPFLFLSAFFITPFSVLLFASLLLPNSSPKTQLPLLAARRPLLLL